MNDSALIGTDKSDDFEPIFERPRSSGSEEFSLHHIWCTIRSHKRLLLGLIITAVLLAAITQFFTTPQYQTLATVQVELIDATGSNDADASSKNAQRIANETRLYRSQAAAKQVVTDLNLLSYPPFGQGVNTPVSDEQLRDAADKLLSWVAVQSVSGSDLIDIRVTSPSAELATKIANQYPASVRTMRLKKRQENKSEVIDKLTAEAERLSNELNEAEQKVADFRRSKRMLVGAGGGEDLAQINRIAAEAASARGISSGASARSAGVERAAGMRSTATATSALLQQQQNQYDSLLSEKAKLSASFGPGHPDMASLNAQISELRENMRSERASVGAKANMEAMAAAARERELARSESSGAAARAGQMNAQLNAITARAYSNTANMVEMSKLERAAEVARITYLSTAQTLEDLRAKLGIVGVNSALAAAAGIPSTPISPKPARTIASAFAGALILGLLIIFAIELLDNKLRNATQMQRLFGLRTMAMFPSIAEMDAVKVEDSPVTLEPQSLFAEVARAFHSEISDIRLSEAPQSVLITSALPGEGKSTVALSLCAAAAAMGRRAILIDFDLRRPTILQEIQQNLDGPDIAAILAGNAEVTALLPEPEQTEHSKNKREIISYRPVVLSVREPVRDPASLLNKNRIARLLADLNDRFDLVIINAPAALAVRDARTLRNLADHMIMVAKWGTTTIPQMRAALNLLGGTADGVVYNRVDYEEHARRGYSDPIEYFVQNAYYYDDVVQPPKSIFGKLRDLFGNINPAARNT